MVPGDRVRLRSNYGKLHAGSEGAISGFYRNEGGENVIVHFDEADEMVPRAELDVVESVSPPRHSSFDRLRDKPQR
jgi:hypothetical protein